VGGGCPGIRASGNAGILVRNHCPSDGRERAQLVQQGVARRIVDDDQSVFRREFGKHGVQLWRNSASEL
jgi:hypothetical protein